MALQQLPLALRACDIRRRSKVARESFAPLLRLGPPFDLFGEIVPPNAVTLGWIIDPRRSQFRFELDPFLDARTFAGFFFRRRELTRSDCLYDRRCSLPRDVDPTSLASPARNGTITQSHSDPFALCAVISWIASACAGSVSRILSKLRRSVSAKSASDSCRPSADAAALSSFSSSLTESPNSSRGRVRNRSRSCVIRPISLTAVKSG